MAGILSFVLFVEWNALPRRDYRRLLWVTSLTLVATPLLVIPVRLSSLLMLVIPLTFFVGTLGERWPAPKRPGAAGITLLAVFGGLWFITSILAFGWAYVALADTLTLLPPFLLFGAFYWMRWWIVRPPRPGLELSE